MCSDFKFNVDTADCIATELVNIGWPAYCKVLNSAEDDVSRPHKSFKASTVACCFLVAALVIASIMELFGDFGRVMEVCVITFLVLLIISFVCLIVSTTRAGNKKFSVSAVVFLFVEEMSSEQLNKISDYGYSVSNVRELVLKKSDIVKLLGWV